MFYATIFYDALAGIGCASLTVLLFVTTLLLIAIRLGWFPAASGLVERLLNGAAKKDPADTDQGSVNVP